VTVPRGVDSPSAGKRDRHVLFNRTSYLDEGHMLLFKRSTRLGRAVLHAARGGGGKSPNGDGYRSGEAG
jgi:hypothetical protein